MRIYGYLVAIMALLSLLVGGMSASKGKPHGHQGMLTPFDGTPLAYELTDEQIQMLDKGSPVSDTRFAITLRPFIMFSNIRLWRRSVQDQVVGEGP